jgi:hypothetical protein
MARDRDLYQGSASALPSRAKKQSRLQPLLAQRLKPILIVRLDTARLEGVP